MAMMKTKNGGEGPWILMRYYEPEGWYGWKRYGSLEEAVKDMPGGYFCEPVVREVAEEEKEINQEDAGLGSRSSRINPCLRDLTS